MELYFKANNPLEEHAIASRFLCPECKSEIEFTRQELISGTDRPIAGDRLIYTCRQCRKEYGFSFYLPPDYDPLKFAEIFGKKGL